MSREKQAEDALVNQAARYEDSIGRNLSDQELAIFQDAMQTIRQGPSYKHSIGTVLRAAFRHYNFDYVRRVLSSFQTAERVLESTPSIVGNALSNYGAKDPERLQMSDDIVGDAEGVLEKSDLGEMITLLIEHGADPDGRDAESKSALYLAVKRGFDKTFERLLEAGADPRQRCPLPGKEASSTAAEDGPITLLQFAFRRLQAHRNLVDRASHLNWRRNIAGRWPRIIILLVRLGLSLEVSEEEKQTFFVAFCEAGSTYGVEQVELLLERLEPDFRFVVEDDFERNVKTALHAASWSCNPDVVRLLLLAGADPDVRCYGSGPTPIEMMCQTPPERSSSIGSWDEVCDMLLDAGCRASDGSTVLLRAVRDERVARVSQLLERGCRLEHVPPCFNVELIDRLLAYGAEMDVSSFFSFALGRDWDYSICNEPSLALLKYLQAKHGARLNPRCFGEIAHFLLGTSRGLTSTMEVLDHLLLELGWGANDPIPLLRGPPYRYNFEAWNLREGVKECAETHPADDVEQTSLLQLACRREGYWSPNVDAARLLLQRGAQVACPGLQESAIALHIRQSGSGNRCLHVPLVQTLLEHDDTGLDLNLLVDHALADVSRNQELVRLLIDRSDSIGFERIRDLLLPKLHIYDAFKDEWFREPQFSFTVPQRALLGIEPPVDDGPKLRPPRQPGSLSKLHCYTTLQGVRAIRLLELHPAFSLDAPLIANMQDFRLDACPSYEALSYVWGDAQCSTSMRIEGGRVDITRNLASALQRLRKTTSVRNLWVDAICINQRDPVEKAQQVALMRDIYISSATTLMYIGEPASNLDSIFGVHNPDPSTSTYLAYGSPGWPPSDSPTTLEFIALGRRPYFRRTWTVQEYTVARNATIICGPYQCDFRSFILALKEATDKSKQSWPLSPQIQRCHAMQIGLPFGRRRPGLAVFAALYLSQHTIATDPRDKVYGLLGLLPERLIPVDYTWSVERVYTEFTRAILLATSGPYESADLWNRIRWRSKYSALPSWVPDWSTSDEVPKLPLQKTSSTGWRFEHRLKGLRFEGDILIVHGKRIDTIAELGCTSYFADTNLELLDKEIVKQVQATMNEWEPLIARLYNRRGQDAIDTFAHMISGIPHGVLYRQHLNYVLWDRIYGANILRRLFPDTTPEEREKALICKALSIPGDQDQEHMRKSHTKWAIGMLETCQRRRLFVTSQGKVGLAPMATLQTDDLVFVPGCPHALVIREHGEDGHIIVGPCYLEELNIESWFGPNTKTPMEEFRFY